MNDYNEVPNPPKDEELEVKVKLTDSTREILRDALVEARKELLSEIPEPLDPSKSHEAWKWNILKEFSVSRQHKPFLGENPYPEFVYFTTQEAETITDLVSQYRETLTGDWAKSEKTACTRLSNLILKELESTRSNAQGIYERRVNRIKMEANREVVPVDYRIEIEARSDGFEIKAVNNKSDESWSPLATAYVNVVCSLSDEGEMQVTYTASGSIWARDNDPKFRNLALAKIEAERLCAEEILRQTVGRC